MTDRLMEQIEAFAEENGLYVEKYDDNFILTVDSPAGVEFEINVSNDGVRNLEDLASILHRNSNELDIDLYIYGELDNAFGDVSIESIINTYYGGMDDEEFAEIWEATFGEDVDIDRAIELRDDAYKMRGILDKLSTKAMEKHEEIEKNDVALRYQIANFMEENGFSTYGDLDDLEFSGYSRLGENMIIPIQDVTSMQDFADKLRNYAEYYDWDEEIKAQMGIDYSFGRFSDVTVEEVNNTADRIGTSIENLWIDMHNECGDVVNGDYLDKLVEIANQMPGVSLEFNDGDEPYVELAFEKGNPGCLIEYHELDAGTDKDEIASMIFDRINDLYGWYDYNDHTREYFEVDARDAMNGFPSDIGAVVEDKKEQRKTIAKLADAVEEMAKNIELEKDAIIVDDNFVVTPTGRDYDFVAIINNTANEDITLYIDGEEFISVQDGDWVGLTNVDLETLQEGKDDIVVKTASQIKEEREQQNKHKNIDER